MVEDMAGHRHTQLPKQLEALQSICKFKLTEFIQLAQGLSDIFLHLSNHMVVVTDFLRFFPDDQASHTIFRVHA